MLKFKKIRQLAVFLTVILVLSQTVFLLSYNVQAVLSPSLSGYYSSIDNGAALSWSFPEFDCRYGYIIITSSDSDLSYINPLKYDAFMEKECGDSDAASMVFPQEAGTNRFYRVCLSGSIDKSQCASQTDPFLVEAPETSEGLNTTTDTVDNTTTEVSANIISPSEGAVLSGEIEIRAGIYQGNYLIEKVLLVDENNNIPVRSMQLDASAVNSVSTSNYSEYKYIWDTASIQTGNYGFYIRVDWNHTTKEDYFSPTVNFSINNEPLAETAATETESINAAEIIDPVNPSVVFLERPGFIEGPITLGAQANFDTGVMTFSVTGPKNKTYSGSLREGNIFDFKWDVVNEAFPFGKYTLEASAYFNGAKYSDSINVEYSEERYDSTEPVFVPEPLQITFNPVLSSPVSGTEKISIGLSKDAEKVELVIDGPVYKKYDCNKNSPRDFYFDWNTAAGVFPDGTYRVTAGAINAGAVESTKAFSAEVRNNNIKETVPETTTAAELFSVSVLEQIIPPISGQYTITAITSQSADSVSFQILGPVERSYNGTRKDDSHYYFVWPTTEFNNGYYKLNIVAKKGEIVAAKSLGLELKNQSVPDADLTLNQDAVLANEQLLDECIKNNIDTTGECKEFMLLAAECREKGIKNKTECDIFLALPFECRERNLNRDNCSNYLNLPSECRRENITDPGICEKYIFQKAMPPECLAAGASSQQECTNMIILKNLPAACLEAGISVAADCEALLGAGSPVEGSGTEKNEETTNMEETEMLQQCLLAGILDLDQCKIYLKEKYLPFECRENGINDMGACNQTMFSKYGPPECRLAGITDESECRSYVFNKYFHEINCTGNKSWQCNSYIKEGFLGSIVAKQAQFKEVKEKADSNKWQVVNVKKLKDSLAGAKSIVPVREDAVNLKFIETKGKIVLKGKNDLVQTSPLAFMIDSDGDGIADDFEKRYGTDPNNDDSDSDGYSDYLEIKNGYNPLGAGKFADSEMAPVERAIMDNAVLEHAKTEGETNDVFKVSEVNNITKQGEYPAGYIFSGQAEPNSVLTLYIYSDLPIVTTVRTNEFGNWEYEFTKSLLEGEHEVYIALNDNTGRVIAKSNPFNFFIKEARAITLEDFLAAAAPEKAPRTESMISFYIIIAALVIIAGVFMFIVLLNIYKNKQRA